MSAILDESSDPILLSEDIVRTLSEENQASHIAPELYEGSPLSPKVLSIFIFVFHANHIFIVVHIFRLIYMHLECVY